MGRLNSSDHLFHPACPWCSQLLWLLVSWGQLLASSDLYLRATWHYSGQALSFPPLLLTADPLFFPSSKELLKTPITWVISRGRQQGTNAIVTYNYQDQQILLRRPIVL